MSRAAGLIFLLGVNQYFKFIRFPEVKFQISKMTALLKQSGYEMLNALLDYVGNYIFVAVVGIMSTTVLAANQVTFTILLMVFIVAMNFGVGVQIFMGRNRGDVYLELSS